MFITYMLENDDQSVSFYFLKGKKNLKYTSISITVLMFKKNVWSLHRVQYAEYNIVQLVRIT